MRIASVASAFPKHYYKHEVVVQALKNEWRNALPNRGYPRPVGREHEGGRPLHG